MEVAGMEVAGMEVFGTPLERKKLAEEVMKNDGLKAKSGALMVKHAEGDWCHICGKRQKGLLSVWYPKNAEHSLKLKDEEKGGEVTRYVRICHGCVKAMSTLLTPQS